MTHIAHDEALLKSILTTFGHQPSVDWHYQQEGNVDVIILDADYCSQGDLEVAYRLSREVVFYTKDFTLAGQKSLVLHKPAHAKDILSALAAAAACLQTHSSHHNAHITEPVGIQTATSTKLKALILGGDKTEFAY
jgi:hypothetical protein